MVAGTYTIEGVDSYGDGWNGSVLIINDNNSGTTYELTLSSGDYNSIDVDVTGGEVALCDYESCLGCTDDTACNYDDSSTQDDGSCYYTTELLDCDGACLDGGVYYQFNIADSYGDGMCCAYGDGSYTITVNGDVVATGGDFGDGASHEFCAPADACVQLIMVADNYPGEQSWTLTADGVELGSGNGASASYDYGTCTPGCTDATACNYDETANIADDSCTYAEGIYDCNGNCNNDEDGDGLCDEEEVAGCVVPGACNYVALPTELEPCVYPDPGYDCEGNCIGDEDGDGVCDANEVVGCQDSTACNYDSSATDAGDCDYESCLGCMDESACNYDADATQEDGSCDYCSCSNAAGGEGGFGLELEEVSNNGINTNLQSVRYYSWIK